MILRIPLPLAAACALALCAGTSLASGSFLAASDWEPRPGEEVRLRLHQGTGFQGDPLAMRRSSVARLVAVGAESRDLLPAMIDGSPSLARLLAEDDEATMIAVETEGSVRRLDAGALDAFAAEHGLAGMAAARRTADIVRGGRLREADCAKLWLAGEKGRRARRPVGLPLELVPRRDPSRVSTLNVQLLFRGRPLSGALVRSWMQPLGEGNAPIDPSTRLDLPVRQWMLTDARGMVRLDVGRRGEWLIASSHAVPSREAAVSDWDAWHASLTMARGVPVIWRSSEPSTLRGTGMWTNPDLGLPPHDRSRSRRDVPGWGRR